MQVGALLSTAVAKPSKHIESGTTGVTRKGAPREPVKKLASTEDLTPHDVDDLEGLDDEDLLLDDGAGTDEDGDDATDDTAGDATEDAATGGTRARKRKTPGGKDATGTKGEEGSKDAKGAKASAASTTGKGGVRKVDRSSGRANAKATSKHTSKRVTAKGTPSASTRYTPPAVRYEDMPSPMWVPILMFTLFVLGMLTIFLNYVALLPGATSNWYLLAGLGFILAGIITATQYR